MLVATKRSGASVEIREYFSLRIGERKPLISVMQLESYQFERAGKTVVATSWVILIL